MVDALCDMRLDFLKRLPTFETFGKGWSRRVAEVKDKASGMA
jgi:lysozyme family protein